MPPRRSTSTSSSEEEEEEEMVFFWRVRFSRSVPSVIFDFDGKRNPTRLIEISLIFFLEGWIIDSVLGEIVISSHCLREGVGKRPISLQPEECCRRGKKEAFKGMSPHFRCGSVQVRQGCQIHQGKGAKPK